MKKELGFCLWFTGLSGSGKSTLANSVTSLISQQRTISLLDGDVIRQYLSKGLGFSKEDRDTHILRLGYISKLITDHGGIVVTATISPYRNIRDQNRKIIKNFVEIYCECGLEVCEKRDIKGLYAKARRAISNGKPMKFTGIDDPYEEPFNPEITVNTSKETIEESTNKIIDKINKLGYLNGYKPRYKRHQPELIPIELIQKSKEIFKNNKIHTNILMRELNIGLDTAIRIINKLGDDNLIKIKM